MSKEKYIAINTELKDLLKVEGIDSKGYGTIQKSVMQDHRLTRDAKCIYSYFRSFAGAGTSAFPSISKICHDLDYGSEDTFRRHFNLLKKCDYVRVKQLHTDGKFSRNVYTLVQCPQSDYTSLPPKVKKRNEKSPSPEIQGTVKNEILSPEIQGTKVQGNKINTNNYKTTTSSTECIELITVNSNTKIDDDVSPIDNIEPKKPATNKTIVKELANKLSTVCDNFGCTVRFRKKVNELGIEESTNRVNFIVENWTSIVENFDTDIKKPAAIVSSAFENIDNYKHDKIKAENGSKKRDTFTNRNPIGNFEQRQYDDAFFDSLYDNLPNNGYNNL